MNKIICVDFDGTCVTHEYPKIGKEIPHSVRVLKRLNEHGVKLILWTMRSGEFLDQAVNWFKENGIELWGINENLQQKEWTQSPKAYAPIYIDDAALGCPLLKDTFGGRDFVDWLKIEKVLTMEKGYLPHYCHRHEQDFTTFIDENSSAKSFARCEKCARDNVDLIRNSLFLTERKIEDCFKVNV